VQLQLLERLIACHEAGGIARGALRERSEFGKCSDTTQQTGNQPQHVCISYIAAEDDKVHPLGLPARHLQALRDSPIPLVCTLCMHSGTRLRSSNSYRGLTLTRVYSPSRYSARSQHDTIAMRAAGAPASSETWRGELAMLPARCCYNCTKALHFSALYHFGQQGLRLTQVAFTLIRAVVRDGGDRCGAGPQQ